MDIARLAHRSPWPVKVAGKIALSQLPISYAQWRRLGLFKHGYMTEPSYVVDVFRSHLARAGLSDLRGKTVLELGPGDSLATAQVAVALGADATILVDVGDYVSSDDAPYGSMADTLRHQIPSARDVPRDFEGVRAVCSYFTAGLASLRELPANSVDLVVSQAVLEHVARDEFNELAQQLRRITRPEGAQSHVIDLRDHLAESLNNLRFSSVFWESSLVRKAGLYTNRLRLSEILDAFNRVGFEVRAQTLSEWPTLPVQRHRLHRDFRRFSDDDLRVKVVAVVAR